MLFWISVILNIVLIFVLVYGWLHLVHYAQEIIRLKKVNKKLRQQLKEKNEQMKHYEDCREQQKDPEPLEREWRIIEPEAKRRK